MSVFTVPTVPYRRFTVGVLLLCLLLAMPALGIPSKDLPSNRRVAGSYQARLAGVPSDSVKTAVPAVPTAAATPPASFTTAALQPIRPAVGPATGRHYALIINGDAGRHHVQNCLDAYRALRSNGFSDRNIFLLSNEAPLGNLRAPTLGPNDGRPSYRNLAVVFKFLREEVKPSDTLVIYVTGHGGVESKGNPPQCYIELVPRANDTSTAHAPKLNLDEFVADVASIKPGRGLLVFDQCFGQVFADALGKGPFATIALSTHAEEVFCQNFSPLFWSEVRRSGVSHKKDPRHSLKAAFIKAARHARRKEKTQRPLLKARFDTTKFFLWE